MKIQITERLSLNEDENWRIYLHSFYNLIQVLFTELNILKQLIGASDSIEHAMDQIQALKEALTDPQKTLSSFTELTNFKTRIFKNIDTAVMNAGDLDQFHLSQLEQSLLSLDRVVKITEEKTKEFLKLFSYKGAWVEFNNEVLTDKLKDVLLTMALHSKGRYGVCFNKEEQQEDDFLFLLNIDTEHKSIMLPALFPDIIRDLVANAKKYSTPGDTITCRLQKREGVLTLTVHDNGRGIPAEEIKNVIKLGYRATNVNPQKILGQGFGLTKAYILTLENNGKMWIDSEEGRYTEITIEIPVPVPSLTKSS